MSVGTARNFGPADSIPAPISQESLATSDVCESLPRLDHCVRSTEIAKLVPGNPSYRTPAPKRFGRLPLATTVSAIRTSRLPPERMDAARASCRVGLQVAPSEKAFPR